ncbi:MAG: helix-turn-helix domain-containing protein [Bacteroidota bacterium]
MKSELSPKILGERIALVRKQKSLSQEELAKVIQVSRPVITQIEGGKRQLTALELKKLAFALELSSDDLLSDDFSEQSRLAEPPLEYVSRKAERISSPQFNHHKCQQILLYLLKAGSGNPHLVKPLIGLLLYFIDFNYYELYEEQLTGSTYRKLSHGPTPEELPALLQQMTSSKLLYKAKGKDSLDHLDRYFPLENPDLTQLRASETHMIEQVLEQFSSTTPEILRTYAQKDLPWIATPFGEVINYELTFYREIPYSVRLYSSELSAL